jgi:lipopolysaccharide transport system permease protein
MKSKLSQALATTAAAALGAVVVTIIGIRTAFRWNCAICSDGLCRPATVEFLCHGSGRCLKSLIGNANLISKVYFPRLIVPIAAVMVALVDFLISFGILVALMIWYQFMPGWQILLLPLFAAIAFVTNFGIGVWITALNVKYRDFRYVVPFIVQLGLYVSPVGFSASIVPEQWRLVYSLNPMVGVIDGFRWCLLGGQNELYLPGLWLSLAVTGFFVWFGIRQFRKMEKSLPI